MLWSWNTSFVKHAPSSKDRDLIIVNYDRLKILWSSQWGARRWGYTSFFIGAYTLFFYKHAVYKHARLKLAEKLSTLLTRPRLRFWGKICVFIIFQYFCHPSVAKTIIFPISLKKCHRFFIDNYDVDAILFLHVDIIVYWYFLIIFFFQSYTMAVYRY